MPKEFDSGLLQHAYSIGDGYYFLVEGTAPHDGKKYGFVTRGKGMQNAATRIPIRMKLKDSAQMPKVLHEAQSRVGVGDRPEFSDYLSALRALKLYDTEFELLYVVMPRYGNLLTGLECDAPGGTAKIGETRLEVAVREFDEEADLTTLCVYDPFPSWMQFSSGCYDEVQHIDFALVTGNPTRLVEGASRWGSVSLKEFPKWVSRQNNPDHLMGWETHQFVPVDGKVVLATMWFIHDIALAMSPVQR